MLRRLKKIKYSSNLVKSLKSDTTIEFELSEFFRKIHTKGVGNR